MKLDFVFIIFLPYLNKLKICLFVLFLKFIFFAANKIVHSLKHRCLKNARFIKNFEVKLHKKWLFFISNFILYVYASLCVET